MIDSKLAPQFDHVSVLESTGLMDTAREYMQAIEQEASYEIGDAGTLNDLFGAALYVQSNMEAKFFGALPKRDMSGANTSASQPLPLSWRAAYSPPALQTHSAGGSIPTGRTYEVEEVSGEIKRSISVVDEDDVRGLRADLLDGVPFSELTRVDELYQDLAIDRDAIAAGVTASNSGYSSRDEVTELDRIIASSDEEANADDVNGTAFTDGDLDIYDIDRSTDTWADAFVDFNSTLRQLTESLMDSFLNGLADFGDLDRENMGILTGRDTAEVLQDLDDNVARFPHDPSNAGREAVEGADTIYGVPGTTRRREYKGIPIVANQTAPSHGSLSTIYVIPTDTITTQNGVEVPRLCVEEYAAPYTETAGRGEDQGFLSIGEFSNKRLFKMDHEVICRDFSATGKLRDIEQ